MKLLLGDQKMLKLPSAPKSLLLAKQVLLLSVLSPRMVHSLYTARTYPTSRGSRALRPDRLALNPHPNLPTNRLSGKAGT